MSGSQTCSRCGQTTPSDALRGLCPRCVAKLTLEAQSIDGAVSEEADAASAKAGSSVSAPAPQTKVLYFGDYELQAEIGRGGMGVVYKARQVSLNRLVAVKMLLAGGFASEEAIRRFKTEAEATANLQHPNIVAIHEVGLHEGLHYLSMDYVEGPSLGELVKDKPLPPEQAARYVEIIARAIHYAHQRGVLHRDLKPSNILIDQFDQPRITDFGLAKRLEDRSEMTMSGKVLGTPGYLPPEQAAGHRGEIGIHSDVYSLGAILYHCLTGRAPFAAESFDETILQVLQKEPAKPRSLNREAPRELEAICLKCLEKSPKDRYASAAALADDLQRWQLGKPVLARPASIARSGWRWCCRRPVAAGMVAASAAAIMAVLTAFLWKPWQGPPNSGRTNNAERFTVFTGIASNCVLDNATRLMWIRNPSGAMHTWRDAVAYCESLDGSEGRGGFTDWRLPSLREMQSVLDYAEANPPLPPEHPFDLSPTLGLGPGWWTITPYRPRLGSSDRVWAVNSFDGNVFYPHQAERLHLWPLRGFSERVMYRVPLPIELLQEMNTRAKTNEMVAQATHYTELLSTTVFETPRALLVGNDPIDFKGSRAVPRLVDWNEDGVLDLLVGSGDGNVWILMAAGKTTLLVLATPIASKPKGTMCGSE